VYLSNHSRDKNDCCGIVEEFEEGREDHADISGCSKKDVYSTYSSEYQESQEGSVRTRSEDGCRALSSSLGLRPDEGVRAFPTTFKDRQTKGKLLLIFIVATEAGRLQDERVPVGVLPERGLLREDLLCPAH
jgi:hypothetical protein